MLKEKHTVLKVFVIIVSVILVLCLCALATMLVVRSGLLGGRNETTAPTTIATTRTEPTEETTEPTTLPPTEPTEPPIPLNRFGPEDFAYQGDYLTCVSEDCLLGIDVSKYQGYIDWQQVKEAGFSFVMIRVGYRGYGQAGNMRPDDMANTHYRGAKEAGLMVGAYFFSQATNEEEAREEALYALELTKDWELDLPIVFDWEYIDEEARTAEVDADTLTACAIAFCQEISDAGRRTMIYYSPWFGNMHLEQLTEYPQWLALYKDQMDYRYHFDMWQYTCTGSVPGVKGEVDINIFFPYGQEEVWP
jgi:GH25 family lysozyme M1 (1,4-beta-N-acetylmuramidase)